MKKTILFVSLVLTIFVGLGAFDLSAQDWANLEAGITTNTAQSQNAIRWPWTAKRKSYLKWWSDKVGLRIIESLNFRPGVRYLNQKSTLSYMADETVFGGEITVDSDLLNAINLPTAIENKLREIRIELPEGMLTRSTQNWTSMAQMEVSIVGFSFRGSYWSGALSPGQFPQPGDVSALFKPEELIGLAARELVAGSAFNNAVSLEFAIHPIPLLTGFRELEWASEGGFYMGGDFSIGLIKTTDLTFKQGRELLGDIDLGEEIRNVLPQFLEELINTDEAGDLLLTAIEGRLPLYGFGLPLASGKTYEIEGWFGYQWKNRTWSGDARIGLMYQWQQLSNDHPSMPTLNIRRWTPTLFVKWVFNKEETDSSLLSAEF